TVYLSYFAGSTTNQRGPWITWLDELFGVRHPLRYGLADAIDDDVVELELAEGLGGLSAGTRLTFAVAGEPSARSYLPVDTAGRPAAPAHRPGRLGRFRTWG